MSRRVVVVLVVVVVGLATAWFRLCRTHAVRASVNEVTTPTDTAMLLDWGHHFEIKLPKGTRSSTAVIPLTASRLGNANRETLSVARFDTETGIYEPVAVTAARDNQLIIEITRAGTYSVMAMPADLSQTSGILSLCRIRSFGGLVGPLSPAKICPQILCPSFESLPGDGFPRWPGLGGVVRPGGICGSCLALGGHRDIFECGMRPPVVLPRLPPGPDALDQFIAKLYTEAFGRAPHPVEWNRDVFQFRWWWWSWRPWWSPFPNGIQQHLPNCEAWIRRGATSFYVSNEYESRAYTAEERVLTLFRGLLSREPDPTQFQHYVNQLAINRPWPLVVEEMLRSSEFHALAQHICLTAEPGYGFGVDVLENPAMPLAASTCGFAPTDPDPMQWQTEIEKQLARPDLPTLVLRQRLVVPLTRTLTIPAGKALATCGYPDPTQYAKMARLVRANLFKAVMVELRDGARLGSVWVSGNGGEGRWTPTTAPNQPGLGFLQSGGDPYVEAPNIRLIGGNAGVITRSRTDSPAGFTTLALWGSLESQAEGRTCTAAVVSRNLSTGYTSRHEPKDARYNPNGKQGTVTAAGWSDGLSIACEDAEVNDNHIVDPTDVGIVVFRACPATQHSRISGNRVLSAGLDGFGALGFDTGPDDGRCASPPRFDGALLSSNSFGTGVNTHFVIGLYVGTRSFTSGHVVGHGGPRLEYNGTGPLAARLTTGIAIDGMLGVNDILTNDIRYAGIRPDNATCRIAKCVAHTADGHASVLPATCVEDKLDDCVNP